ncbi:unnamed protein product [Nippostrongylus brasiliensis]|uniref:DUF1758 domain-containing protein n=1 Tax=Nippostrongylus brasiliensis TaxID=27835 RepID=A0A0N4YKG7_NIPBR|nr:unnamed protein product [Nippostrongylus brasiliensis]
MDTQLRKCKRTITTCCKKLDTIINELRQGESTIERRRAGGAIAQLETYIKKLEEAQEDYASTLDRVSNISDAESTDHEHYSAVAEAAWMAALDLISELEGQHRTLLDNLQIVVAQLRDSGEHVDSQWLIRQVLTKFPQSVQTRILERRCSVEEPFLMNNLLEALDKYITCQERMTMYTSNNGSTPSQQPTIERTRSAQRTRDERPARGPPLRAAFPCMYCSQQHKAVSCTRYNTPQQRATYLREHKLCLICASPQHSTDECHGRSCLRCQGRHHTSVCFKAQVATPADSAPIKPQRKDYAPAATVKPKAKDTDNKQSHKSVKQLAALCPDSDTGHTSDEDVESIAEYHASRNLLGTGETYLPIGELTIHDPSTDQLRKVVALLDSGAQCSFIDQQLADEMQLPTVSTSKLHLRTFGAQHDIEVQTRRVPLKVWDNNGCPYQLQLLTHTTLTKSLRTPSLQEADLTFIKDNGLNVNVGRARKVKPQILLGSDQLWQLMSTDSTSVRLPSGLYLLPTRLGHLVTGQLLVRRQKPNTESTDQENENGAPTVQHVTMYEMSMADPDPPDKDQAAWEQFLRLNQEGQEEFGEDGRCDTVPKQVALVAPNSETSPQPTTAYSDIFSNIKTSDLASIRRIVAYTLRFIHNTVHSFQVAPSLHTTQDGNDDPDYELPGAQQQSLTKKQLVEAVNSSTSNVNQFWHQWQHEYLTSLREYHVREAITARGSRIPPTVGQIVLICDAGQPRHSWRMGRINELRHDSENKVREALVTLPSKREIRRPVNLLVPLELDIHEMPPTSPSEHNQPSEDVQQPVGEASEPTARQPPYNLRKKDRVDYAKLAGQATTVTTTSSRSTTDNRDSASNTSTHKPVQSL